ncbi:hypothetical protein V565_305110, partial [Rhizoctonia solani 123E]
MGLMALRLHCGVDAQGCSAEAVLCAQTSVTIVPPIGHVIDLADYRPPALTPDTLIKRGCIGGCPVVKPQSLVAKVWTQSTASALRPWALTPEWSLKAIGPVWLAQLLTPHHLVDQPPRQPSMPAEIAAVTIDMTSRRVTSTKRLPPHGAPNQGNLAD